MISFRVEGKPVSKKNKLRVSKNGGVFYDRDSRVHPVIAAVQSAAYEARTPDYPLPPETPFMVTMNFYARSWGSGDIDGWATTILDAMEGILYDNDKYCARLYLNKDIISKKAKPYFEITVQPLPPCRHDTISSE